MSNVHSTYNNLNLSRLVRIPLAAIGLFPRQNGFRDVLTSRAYEYVIDTHSFTASFVLIEVKEGFVYFLLTQYWPNQRTLRRYNLRPEIVLIRDKYMSFRYEC